MAEYRLTAEEKAAAIARAEALRERLTAATPPPPRDGEVCACGHARGDHDDEGCVRLCACSVPDHLGPCGRCECARPAAPSEPPAEPAGYREAWDRWAAAVEADAPPERLRELWAAMNATLPPVPEDDQASVRAAQIAALTAGIGGPPDCSLPPAEAQQDDCRHLTWSVDLETGAAKCARCGVPWTETQPPAEAQQDDKHWPDAVLIEGDWISPRKEAHARDLTKSWANAAKDAGCPPRFVARMRTFVELHDRLHAESAALAARPSADTEKLRHLAAEFDANGNARPLGDPAAAAWHKAARLLRAALDAR